MVSWLPVSSEDLSALLIVMKDTGVVGGSQDLLKHRRSQLKPYRFP